MSAASNAVIKGLEKGATKAVDHVVHRVIRKKPRTPPATKTKRTPQQQAHLNKLIVGGGIATIHDFVQRNK